MGYGGWRCKGNSGGSKETMAIVVTMVMAVVV